MVVTVIIPALADPSDPYNEQHLRVLTSLDEVKSIILLSDIPGSDGLILKLFATSFDILSGASRPDTGEELSKNIEYHMTSMLVTLVDECQSLPTGVVDIVLAQFLRADPSTFLLQAKKSGDRRDMPQLQQLPAPYNMAKSICNSSSDKMTRAISQYFSSVIVDTSENVHSAKVKKITNGKRRKSAEESDDEDDGKPAHSEEDYKELHKVHRLLRELWRSCPDVIQNLVPQLETELGAENVQLRILATETVGDLISGIGAAGPPPSAPMDPIAYPSQSLEPASARSTSYNFLTTPSAPHAFSSVYPHTYQVFMNRRKDRTAQIRSTWVTCAGRILSTSAGGVGLDPEEENEILQSTAEMLVDQDERVRLAAVEAIARFDFDDIVKKLGAHGSVTDEGSVLGNLADRIKDRKHSIRVQAMELLGRLWGVAAGAIIEGNERVRQLLGAIPSKIFEAIYVNDREINALVNKVLFDSLLPLGFPPIKKDRATNGDSQRVRDSQTAATQEDRTDPDAVRAERLLVLVRDLEQKAKAVFFALQQRQTGNAKYLEKFLSCCEAFNGGVTSKDGNSAKSNLTKLIGVLARTMPDPDAAMDHLWKFAKMHDRRCYVLIRFAMSPDSEYMKVYRSLRELTKRIEDAPGSTAGVLTTLIPIVHSASVLLYNRSHVPAIMDISRTDDKGLGAIAHEILNQISTVNPEVFKAHVRTLCTTLEKLAPDPGVKVDAGTVETLKACAGFAQRFPDEMPKTREFMQSMVQFALHGDPARAAKHAVSVIAASQHNREMYINEVVNKCTKDFAYGSDDYLSKLAALSQLMLHAAGEIEEHHDAIVSIAIQDILLQVRTPAKDDDPAWQDEIDEDCAAKIWALKILANRLRWYATSASSEELERTGLEHARPVYKLLLTIIEDEGEVSKQKDTPAHHKSRLRLTAAILLLKLSASSKRLDALLTPSSFNHLATTTQDALPEVRSAFVSAVKKYLGTAHLPARFYALVFLYAFEPNAATKDATVTWLRARSAAAAKAADTVIEASFARFLSLLAHHPDFSMETEHLTDFVEYILFYLRCAASRENLALIFHVAQRVKSVADGIDEAKSENLYVLSDIAQAVIRAFEEAQGWGPLQVWPGKLRMPAGLFKPLPDHRTAQEIAERQFAPAELVERIDNLVRAGLKSRKRKPVDAGAGAQRKKVKAKEVAAKKERKERVAKTPKRKGEVDVAPSSEVRRSSRRSTAGAKNYAESEESDDGEEVVGGDDDDDKENVESDRPETSEPVAKENRAVRSSKRGRRDKTPEVQEISDEELSDPPESDEED